MFIIKVPWKLFFLIILINILTITSDRFTSKEKRSILTNPDEELRRTKRSIYQALLKKKFQDKRSDDSDDGVSMEDVYSTTPRPYVKKQVQEVRIEIKLIHDWRDEMSNITSPEFNLLAGNAIDAITNEFSANTNYLSTKVVKLESTANKNQVLADLSLRFYKTEEDPIAHMEGIITNGWIAGQQVDPTYFKTLGTTNGNQEKSPWHYPEDVQLRVVPAMKAPENVSHHARFHQQLVRYKEIRISIKLKQKFIIFLQDKKSPEYSSLSGNVEEAITKIFVHDTLYIDAEVLEFRESPEGRVIVYCAIQFQLEEKYAIEKCQAMISSGDMEGMPVDDRFFVVNALSEVGGPTTPTKNNMTLPSNVPQPQPMPKKTKTKPLRYKELRVSIKLQQPWNISFGDNTTNIYSIIGGTIEAAVDRALAENPYYIDATILEFLESPEHTTIANLAIRYKLEEEDPEGKSREIIKNGSVSGFPADPNFFYVFSLSETMHPERNESSNGNDSTVFVSNNTMKQNNGQKQPAVDQNNVQNNVPNLVTKVNSLRPSVFINGTTDNELKPTNATPIDLSSGQTYTDKNPISKPGIVVSEASLDTTMAPITSPQVSKTPEVVTYNPYLPTNATPTFNPYLPTTPQNISADVNNNTVLHKIKVETNTVQGSMTLEQTWSPSFADKSNQLYRILAQTVIKAIKTVYTEVHEDVVPEVLGFSETNVPASSITLSTEKKVAVRFKVLFIKGHNADIGPLEHAVAVKSVSGILIHQNSLAAVASNNEMEKSGDNKKVQLSLCQEQQKEAETASDGNIGGFVPQCNRDGSYKEVQCHALTGYCWCVNKVGVRIQDTEEKYKEPSCDGTKFRGRVILPEHSPHQLLPNSCLTISVQEIILCGKDVNCHIPLVANKTFKSITIEEHAISYEITTPRLKPGRYNIAATINVGWCRINSVKSKDLIHTGDYHSVAMHDVVIETDTRIIEQDVIVDITLPEETGILLHGRVLLPDDSPMTSIPPGSCISIKTKLLNVCTGTSCPVLPVYGNTTITDLEVDNNTIPYSMQMPDLEPGTYVISAVLHIKKCEDGDQTMVPGDYYNDEMHDYTVAPHTTDVEKDIKMVKLKDSKAGGVFISGRVLLPTFEQPLLERACLTISSRKLIQCKSNTCKIPPVATKTFENITNDGGIPYTLLLPVASPGKYIISAVVNNGWCKYNDLKDWIHAGDFYNTKVHDFEIKTDTLVVGKNIQVEKFDPEEPKPGVTIHGRVKLPPSSNETFSSKSCLTIKAQEFKLCGGGINCLNPLTAKETFHDFNLEAHTIPYAIVIPNTATGHFIISAVLNIDWCKDDDASSQDFIHNGDYHNEETHDFVLSEGMTEVQKDITLEEYSDVVTAAPSINVHSPSQPYSPSYVSTEMPRVSAQQATTKEADIILGTTLQPVVISAGTSRTVKSEITTPNAAASKANVQPSTDRAPLTKEELIKLIVTTDKPHGNLIYDTQQPITIGVGQLYPIKTEQQVSTTQAMTEPSIEVNTTTTPILSSQATLDDLITLPQGLPKSCQEIRDAGIGKLDGQYIIEARSGCHLSIICQDMEDKEKAPKEFLGGPSEAEWKYWHYAVLIKLSYQDKQNIPTGACLEKTEGGKELIKRIIQAGAQQGNPVADWQTNIAQLLTRRGKRNIHADKTIITKSVKIYKNPKGKRSEKESKSHWGVL